MIGISVVQPEFLTAEDAQILTMSYCGVCASLRRHYGELSSLLVNYDARFLALLILAQRQFAASKGQVTCPLKGYVGSNQIVMDEVATKFASAITLLLFEEKLEDKSRDEGSLTAKSLGRYVNKINAEKTVSYLTDMGFPVDILEKSKISQKLVEKKYTDLDAYLEPTATVLGEVFSYTAVISGEPANQSILRELGQTIGKIVVLIDAIEDINTDVRKNKFNPIASEWKINKQDFLQIRILTSLCLLLAEQFQQVDTSLSQLRFYHYRSAIENILSRGVPNRVTAALRSLWHENHWIGELPFSSHDFLDLPSCSICKLPHLSHKKKRVEKKNPSFWSVSLTLNHAQGIANDLHITREEYIFGSLFPSFCY